MQISSHGAFKAFQGFGIYSASKFAVEGFSEALAIEVAPLGIKVTLVARIFENRLYRQFIQASRNNH